MKWRRWLVAAVVLVALLQLAALGMKILCLESALTRGERFVFRTAPIDPYDAFRGRYVALSQESLEVKTADTRHFGRGERVWVTIEPAQEGFSTFGAVSKERPAGAAVRARIEWTSGDTVRIAPPFSRFYMNEKLAPRAERAYRAHSTRTKRDASLGVRVLDGVGVIEELYVGGKPIREFLEEEERE